MENTDKFISCLNDFYNKSSTENGAIGYSTTNNKLLDLFFSISSIRFLKDDEEEIENVRNKFIEAYENEPNKELILRFLFLIRDIKNGLGERYAFKLFLTTLLYKDPDLVNRIVNSNIIENSFGRWDDYICLISEYVYNNNKLYNYSCNYDKIINVINSIYSKLYKQLLIDVSNMNSGKQISLLAKWMPSINSTSKVSTKLATTFVKAWKIKNCDYRKMLSKLRKHLNIVECNLSNRNYENINYEYVPGLAMLKYKNTFINKDLERYSVYMAKVARHKANINTQTVNLVDVIRKYAPSVQYRGVYDITYEEMWNKILDNNKSFSKKLMPVVDTSGSMTSFNAIPYYTAMSFGLFLAEKNVGPYNGKMILFSSEPEYIDISNDKTLMDKINHYHKYSDYSNTDIAKTMELILNTAIENKLSQDDIPDIIIFSDMEFDSIISKNKYEKLFKVISAKFNDAGYKLPNITFWNIASRTNTIPIVENENGVKLISGYSQHIIDMILSDKLDPYEVLLEKLMSERYDVVKTI